MAKLRYTLRDSSRKVELNASWVEELYYGPVQVVNGYAEVPDHDDIAILVLCNRGFELVKDDEEADAPEAPVQEEEPSLEETLRKMTRAQLNTDAGRYGLTEDAESFDTKGELIDAILAANEEEQD